MGLSVDHAFVDGFDKVGGAGLCIGAAGPGRGGLDGAGGKLKVLAGTTYRMALSSG